MKSRGFFHTPQDIMEEYNGCSVPQYTRYPRYGFQSTEGFLAILEKIQSLFEITGGGMKTSSSIALDSNTMGSFGHSNATILTSIPVNDNKQPPNTQCSPSYASGPDPSEFGTNMINPRIVVIIPITNK